MSDCAVAVYNIHIMAASYTMDHSLKSNVMVNNKLIWESSNELESRGVNLMYLDTSTGLVSNVSHFDTSSDAGASSVLVAMLNNSLKEAILIGVTYDDPMASLSETAKAALQLIGVIVDDVPYHGRFAFVAQIGYKERTRMVKSTNSQGSSVLEVRLVGE